MTIVPHSAHGISQATVFSLIDERWNELLKKLSSFADYKDDWDGMGSVAPEPEVLQAAAVIACELRSSEHPAPDRVLVTVDGTICFETGPFPVQTIEVLSGSEAEVWEGGNQLAWSLMKEEL